MDEIYKKGQLTIVPMHSYNAAHNLIPRKNSAPATGSITAIVITTSRLAIPVRQTEHLRVARFL
jgi:hypothetical protein